MDEMQARPRTFEQSLLELERIVRELEDGKLGLDEALACYEQGVGLIKSCYEQLRQAEQRILLLSSAEEEGPPILQPFKHEATAPGTVDLRRPRHRGDEGPGSLSRR
jgi:exodeoxyribonuclease VII small subunit